jgi:hypothetical protein
LQRGSESNSVSQLSSVSSRLFTENCSCAGRGMYKCWSADGIYLYKEVVNVLRRQRANVDRLDVKEFEVNLRTRLLCRGGGSSVGARKWWCYQHWSPGSWELVGGCCC